MTIVPDLQAKRMGTLAPGELIRLAFRSVTPLALVIGCDWLGIPSGKGILLLEEVPDRPDLSLRLFPMSDAQTIETALSYGTGHIIVVEAGARIATPFTPEFETNGSLVIGDGLQVLRVQSGNPRMSHTAIMVDVNIWKAIQGAGGSAEKMAVLDWQLRMFPDDRIDPQPAPIFSFRG